MLNINIMTISVMIKAQIASESYQGEMVFRNSGLRSNFMIEAIP